MAEVALPGGRVASYQVIGSGKPLRIEPGYSAVEELVATGTQGSGSA
jgi:hypothetical protein